MLLLIKRLMILCSDTIINQENLLEAAPNLIGTKLKEDTFESIVSEQISRYVNSFEGNIPPDFYEFIMNKIEKPLIGEILRITSGNKKKAAEILGINRNTLAKKLSN